MTTQSRSAKDLFVELVGSVPPEAWDERLTQLCQGDDELHGRVRALLRAHADPGSFLLEQPAITGNGGARQERAVSETVGTVIGPYKLLQQIGEGGMGVVFMAAQSQPVQRTVALKVIKPGMDTQQVIARFEAERQALALMNHPNIAGVLDAGTTDTGRPYFVMDLVKGIPITEYCDQQHLPVRARLELMSVVCQAVQHAHQKGIIHRDLKPSNVLVAEYDGRPVPKVIDFGVAKATAQRLTEKTMFTEYGQLIGTFEYMSPEQARFNQLDVDTRSDIYSLGVLLYETLAGSTPLEKERLRSAAFNEVLRIICEEEPPRPSQRLSSSQLQPSISANRSLEPKQLRGLVRGELDWIVMKCLEKDRNRRYETANALAADLAHYLNDEPVDARRATRLYRLKKFYRRNKATAITGAAIVAALLIGLILASVGFLQARRQAEIAAAQASKAVAINDLLQQMLKSARPYAAKGNEYTVRQMLEEFSAKLDDQIHNQPEVEAAIRATIGNALLELDDPDEAAPHLKGALEIRRRLFGEDHQDVANSYADYAYVALHNEKVVEAEELLRKSLAIYEKLRVENDAAVSAHSSLGLVLWRQMRYPDAELVYQNAYEMARRLDAQVEVATILYRQSMLVLSTPGNAAKAERLARQSLALSRQLHGTHHTNPAWVLWTLALALQEQNKLDEAEQCFRETIAIFREQYGDAHFHVYNARADLRAVLLSRGDQAGLAALDTEQSATEVTALAGFDKSIKLRPDSPYRRARRGYIHAFRGEFDKADADLARATDSAYENSAVTVTRALVCLARDDDAGFRKASKDLADVAARGTDSRAAEFAVTLFIIVPDSAIDSQQAVELARRSLEAGSHSGEVLGRLGAALYRAGRYEEAVQRLTEALDIVSKDRAKTEIKAGGNLFLAMTHHRLGHAKEATEFLDRAVKIIDARQGQAAYWPYSMLLERLRHETEALLGAKREAATQKTTERIEQPTPAIETPTSSNKQHGDEQPPNTNNPTSVTPPNIEH